ncbi:hypothetical protein ACQKWADRAFT_168101 [Trichoderma austrokoningii]
MQARSEECLFVCLSVCDSDKSELHAARAFCSKSRKMATNRSDALDAKDSARQTRAGLMHRTKNFFFLFSPSFRVRWQRKHGDPGDLFTVGLGRWVCSLRCSPRNCLPYSAEKNRMLLEFKAVSWAVPRQAENNVAPSGDAQSKWDRKSGEADAIEQPKVGQGRLQIARICGLGLPSHDRQRPSPPDGACTSTWATCTKPRRYELVISPVPRNTVVILHRGTGHIGTGID